MNLPLFHETGDAILKWIEADEDKLTTDARIVESSERAKFEYLNSSTYIYMLRHSVAQRRTV